ncbi:hypothetical protein ACH5RR_039786 [Cinchona calisaya]|uniref:Uncharacterized protein n=1 Tax=Cinchona calisaya TaxID=153742 RepID=A0ABD2Y0K0_9GENT
MHFLGESDELKRKTNEKKEAKRKMKDNRKKEEIKGKNGLDNEDENGENLLQGISAPTNGTSAKSIEAGVKSIRTSAQAIAIVVTKSLSAKTSSSAGISIIPIVDSHDLVERAAENYSNAAARNSRVVPTVISHEKSTQGVCLATTQIQENVMANVTISNIGPPKEFSNIVALHQVAITPSQEKEITTFEQNVVVEARGGSAKTDETSKKMGENSWVRKVKDKVGQIAEITGAEMKEWEQHSIYKLPAYVTDLNINAYKPRAISFGPYHYGEQNLKPMESHKERALLHFLNRSRKPLDCYVDALGEVVQDLKNAYDSLEDKWQQDSEAFLELMIQDGCFMIEILTTSSTDHHQSMDDYAPNDPIFSKHGQLYLMPYITRDMLMLENQLPMLLLKTLLAVDNEDAQTDEEFINKLIHKFYFPYTPSMKLGKCLHVLDVYRRILLWEVPTVRKRKISSQKYLRDENNILSARELQESGIRIKSNKISKSLKSISFDRKLGILRLPSIPVDDTSETMFLNLMAFERFHAGAGNAVTDYVYFMDKLIDNSQDVNILQFRKIIQNEIGSEKAVARLFNSLLKDVALDPESRLNEVRVMINKYCKTKWHKWRGSLIQTYFRNPWALISVIAAIILFALTTSQTMYGALQYYQALKTSPPSPPPPAPH